MAIYKRRWYHNIYLEFHLEIPFFTVHTRLFREAIERMTYDICRLQIKLYKWSWEFQAYKRPYEYYGSPPPKQPRWVHTKALLRTLHLSRASTK